MRAPDDVLELTRERGIYYTSLHAGMQAVSDVYNGKVTVPLPDMEKEEKPSIPNLLQQGVDQLAGRAMSTVPSVSFASTDPGKRAKDRNAAAASATCTGWWQADRLGTKMKTRSRRFFAYAMAPVVIRWNYKEHRPMWQVRHPLETFPSTDIEPGRILPDDCIFKYKRTVKWMKSNGHEENLRKLVGRHDELRNDALVDLVEYIDEDQIMLLATGYYPQNGYASGSNGQRAVVLSSYENLAKNIPVSIPIRMSLDDPAGQFDGMIGMYFQQAQLQALETIAVAKGIFPDTYLESHPGTLAKIVDGPHDGRTGKITIVQDGNIKTEQSQPGYLTNPMIDRLERAQRVTAGIPAEFGGESGTNIRTGRRGDAVLSATIDVTIAEAQAEFENALMEENRIGIQMAKRIDGSAKRTIYVGTGNSRRPVTYEATKTFETEEHVVSFPASGNDANSLIIGVAQRVGLGIMSKETAATLDPFIDNPEVEHDSIISEGLEQAIMSGIQQQAAAGSIPPLVVSKVMMLVKNDKKELAEALTIVTEEAQAAEAAKAQAAQAGVQGPQGAEQAMSASAIQTLAGGVPDPNQIIPGQQNLSDLMSQTRRPAMTINPMRGAAQGAI